MTKLEKKLRNELYHHFHILAHVEGTPEQKEAVYLDARNILKKHVNRDTSVEMRKAAVNTLIDLMKLKEWETIVITG